MKRVITMSILAGSLAISLVAQNAVPKPAADGSDSYGFQLGTIGGGASFGGAHLGDLGGMHPAALGSFDIGLHKYLGVFTEGAWSHAKDGYVSVNYYNVSGGLEVVGSNHSRIVPYGRVGFGYSSATAGAGGFSASAGAPAIVGGGGVRSYINHHFGIDAQVLAFRTVGHNGGQTAIVPTVGVFFQSK